MNTNYEQLRQNMIARQIITRGIRDEKVLAAFQKIPRHLFVPPQHRHQAYEDYPLTIGHSQTISQPYIVALMTEQLDIQPDHDVLEIGTGCGYQTAILACLAHRAYTIELIPELAQTAKKILETLNLTNIQYHTGNGRNGWPDEKSFDRILVAATAQSTPPALIRQLKNNGKIVIPLESNQAQKLMLLQKQKDQLKESLLCHCRFVPLINP